VAIIMDGNGRWATMRGLARAAGHARGAEAVRRAVRAARAARIEALTLFAFSTENWARPAGEVAHLWSLLVEFLRNERAELLENGIRLVVIGQRARLPAPVQAVIAETEAITAAGASMTLCLAVSYGAREDLVAAVRRIAARVRDGALDPTAIDEHTVGSALSTSGLPPVDLVIRTSGEQRLSNFLLWEVAYAELHFTARSWPDFREQDLAAALEAYARRQRRFGAVLDEEAS
jgi:undecaprenyl diphosphate synthase